MVCNVVMDKKKTWQISGDVSTVEAGRATAEKHGDLSLVVCSAMALWYAVGKEVRRQIMKKYESARSNSRYGGTVLEEFMLLDPQSALTATDSPQTPAAPDPAAQTKEAMRAHVAGGWAKTPGQGKVLPASPRRRHPRSA